jgi:hypothetical protein
VNVRRTSGEIVNATLLETFLALVFLIFGLALFESQRADAAQAAMAGVPSAATLDSLRQQLESLTRLDSARADSLRRLYAANDSLRGVLISKYPPDCEPNAEPAEWLTVTLLGKERMGVVVHRSAHGLEAGAQFETTPDAFSRRFEAARIESEKHRCKYLVRIEDTPGTSKQDFKRALSAVTAVFRPRNFLR